jgi:hypothetical protein
MGGWVFSLGSRVWDGGRARTLRVYNSFQRVRQNKSSVIMTLDPNKFAEKNQQRLHIGNQPYFTPSISLHNQSSPVSALRLYYDKSDRNYEPGTTIYSTYPPDTKSFLYYFMPPDKPCIAAELRLRVTSSKDPASFESGSDLLKSNGQPWSRPLWILPRYYNRLYEKLREDRLVPDDLDAVLSTFTSNFADLNFFIH